MIRILLLVALCVSGALPSYFCTDDGEYTRLLCRVVSVAAPLEVTWFINDTDVASLDVSDGTTEGQWTVDLYSRNTVRVSVLTVYESVRRRDAYRCRFRFNDSRTETVHRVDAKTSPLRDCARCRSDFNRVAWCSLCTAIGIVLTMYGALSYRERLKWIMTRDAYFEELSGESDLI